MRYTLEIQKLINRANQENIHPKDAGKLLLDAIRIADENEDVELGYELRGDLMDAEWGLADRTEFVSLFSWMLNVYDSDPESYDVEDLLWKYKWIIYELYSNPDVPLEQIENVLEDYKRRLEEQGFGIRSYYSKQLNEAIYQQDSAKSDQFLAKVNAHSHDELSDCRACEMDTQVHYHINQGDFDTAYTQALPLINKQFTCAHVPVITYCQLCHMAIKHNQPEKAAELFLQAEEGLQECEHDSSLITSVAHLIVYLFHTDKEKGWDYIEKYLKWSDTMKSNRKFFFASRMAEALQLEDQEKVVQLELPESHPLYTPANTYKAGDIYHYYEQEARKYASEFDQRNRNSNFTTQLEKALN